MNSRFFFSRSELRKQKLQIGCFDQPADGWLNTDVTPHIWLARLPGAVQLMHSLGALSDLRYQQHRAGIFKRVHYLDILRPFPFSDATLTAVFCSHVLEHIHANDARKVLDEVRRVLKPEGVFRVVVPSLELALSRYTPESPGECLEMIFENQHAGEKNIHKWMYTERSLQKVLTDTGFIDVTVCRYRVGSLPDLELLDNRPENSIYVEGFKSIT